MGVTEFTERPMSQGNQVLAPTPTAHASVMMTAITTASSEANRSAASARSTDYINQIEFRDSAFVSEASKTDQPTHERPTDSSQAKSRSIKKKREPPKPISKKRSSPSSTKGQSPPAAGRTRVPKLKLPPRGGSPGSSGPSLSRVADQSKATARASLPPPLSPTGTLTQPQYAPGPGPASSAAGPASSASVVSTRKSVRMHTTPLSPKALVHSVSTTADNPIGKTSPKANMSRARLTSPISSSIHSAIKGSTTGRAPMRASGSGARMRRSG